MDVNCLSLTQRPTSHPETYRFFFRYHPLLVRPLRTRSGREIGGDEGIFVTVFEDDMVDVGSQVESTADGEAPIKVIRMIERRNVKRVVIPAKIQPTRGTRFDR